MKLGLSTLIVFLSFTLVAQVNKVDSQGRKQGPWQKKYEGIHVLKYKGQFLNDKPIGTFTYYYKSSKVKAIIKHTGKGRSEAYYYHEGGALMSYGIFKNEQKDSTWLNFGPSERISNTETYKNGVLHGKKVVYYVPADPADKSQIPSTVSLYVDGELEGEYKEYHQNTGVKVTGAYKSNKRHGIWMHYLPNGRKLHLIRWKDGKKHGWCISYDESGAEQYKVYYYYGRPLTGKALEEKMAQMKKLGINPNE